MAGKTKEMSQIKQLLLLKKDGVSNRSAAKIIGMNKETVNHYVNKVKDDRLSIDELLKLDDPILEHRLKCGNIWEAYRKCLYRAISRLPLSRPTDTNHP